MNVHSPYRVVPILWRSILLAHFLMLILDSGIALSDNKPAAQYGIEIWNADRGFTPFSTSAIAQTPDGYLWLGTDEGLVRFDGVQFTSFNTENTKALRHNDVSSLCVTRSGALWIGTKGGGVSLFRGNEFKTFTTEDGLPENGILSLGAGDSDEVWVGMAFKGFVRIAGNIIQQFPINQHHAGPVYCAMKGSDGALNVATGVSYLRKPWGSDSITIVASLPSLIFSICQRRDGSILIGTLDGIYRYSRGSLHPFPDSAVGAIRAARAIFEDRAGNLWIGTEGSGLFFFSGGTLTRFGASDGFPSSRVFCIFEDREENLWFGTRGGGLMRLKRSLVLMMSTNNGLPSEQVSLVGEDKEKNFWIGTRDSGIVAVRNGKILAKYTSRNGLADNHVRSFFEDSHGNAWIGTQSGLSLFSRQTGSISSSAKSVRANGQTLQSVRIIMEDRRHQIWIGSSSDGVFLYDPRMFSLMRVEDHPQSDYLAVRTMIEVSDGTIWVGTRGGLATIKSGIMKPFTAANGVAVKEVFAIHEDEQGALWVGTYGDGLLRIEDGRVSRITRQEGLFDDVVYAIIDDRMGNFWMSCNKGIFRVGKHELDAFANGSISSVISRSLGVTDGMASVECNGGSSPSAWRSEDGKIFFPTMKGVAIIDPARLGSAPNSPWPVIEEVDVNDAVMKPIPPLALGLGKRRIEFRYTGLSFFRPEKIEFRYMLEGFDDNWIASGAMRKANYTNLPPGEYNFRVSAMNSGGVWSDVAAVLPVVVPPYFWETIWFRVSGVLVALAMVFGIARVVSTRTLRLRLRELEAQQALDRERARISKDMHDEVGASLTQIAILSELLGRNLDNRDTAETHLKHISTTAQEVVGSLDEIVWFINPRHDTLESLMLYLREYIANYFESIDIKCRFAYPEAFPTMALAADIRRNIFLVAKEVVNNIAKHAHAHTVRIAVTIGGGTLIVSIGDDGGGIPAEKLSEFGNGLKNMKKRMEEIGGTFWIGGTEGGGTTVKIMAQINRHA